VAFSDDDPKEGYARLILTIKGMVVKHKFTVGGKKPYAENAHISVSFSDG